MLTIRTLPELPAGAKYECVWGSATPTDAVVTATGLTCRTPSLKQRPHIPARKDHVLVPLAVRSSETNKDFVSRNFAFFDCGRHTTCSTCVKSSWACNWCVYENTCIYNASVCGGTVVSGENVSIFKLLEEVCCAGDLECSRMAPGLVKKSYHQHLFLLDFCLGCFFSSSLVFINK